MPKWGGNAALCWRLGGSGLFGCGGLLGRGGLLGGVAFLLALPSLLLGDLGGNLLGVDLLGNRPRVPVHFAPFRGDGVEVFRCSHFGSSQARAGAGGGACGVESGVGGWWEGCDRWGEGDWAEGMVRWCWWGGEVVEY